MATWGVLQQGDVTECKYESGRPPDSGGTLGRLSGAPAGQECYARTACWLGHHEAAPPTRLRPTSREPPTMLEINVTLSRIKDMQGRLDALRGYL